MSERRDKLLALRKKIIVGNPPFEVDEVMGTHRRREGAAGLEELRAIGDYFPGAQTQRMNLEILLEIVEDLLERAK